MNRYTEALTALGGEATAGNMWRWHQKHTKRILCRKRGIFMLGLYSNAGQGYRRTKTGWRLLTPEEETRKAEIRKQVRALLKEKGASPGFVLQHFTENLVKELYAKELH